MNKSIELLAPVSSFASLQAAIASGADAIYFGIGLLNMRAKNSNNFQLEDLKEITSICKKKKIQTYVTLNTVLYDEDQEQMKLICQALKKNKVHAIIASDLSVITYARSIGLCVHASTQLNICNLEAVRFYSQFADTMVLARELTLDQISSICKEIQNQEIKGPSGNLVKIEIFIHGALCVAISGKCYMSLAQYNRSANRGDCLQACRRTYKVHEEETEKELAIENKYIMSPKDLCTIGFLDQILQSGVAILKIEGRARSPEYVSTVTRTYREAIDAVLNNTYSAEKIKGWITNLDSVYNRGFWQGGYYLGKKLEEWSGSYGSKATRKKIYLGKVLNFFLRINIVETKLESNPLKIGDQILIMGPKTGTFETIITELRKDDKTPAKLCEKGETVTFFVSKKVQKNDQIYLYKTQENLLTTQKNHE